MLVDSHFKSNDHRPVSPGVLGEVDGDYDPTREHDYRPTNEYDHYDEPASDDHYDNERRRYPAGPMDLQL
jgi:hypothetical protein